MRELAPADPANELLREAETLLALAPELRTTTAVPQPAPLRAKIHEQLQAFEVRAVASGLGAARIVKAKSLIAALLDDIATTMPWGAGGAWEPLGSTHAGASPVQRLLAVARDSQADAGLRQLLGIVLGLGFDARQNAAAGAAELALLRAQLAPHRGAAAAGAAQVLAPRWRPAVRARDALASWLPLWTGALVCAALLAVLYLGLVLRLGSASDAFYAALARLPPAAPVPADSGGVPRLAPLMAQAQTGAAPRFVVRDERDRSLVVIPEEQLFGAGSAQLRTEAAPLLRALATALGQVPGRILVIGHTAAASPRSARYPSDWDLSIDRARAVGDALQLAGIPAGRLRADGRAATEPLAPDDAARRIGGDGRIDVELQVGR